MKSFLAFAAVGLLACGSDPPPPVAVPPAAPSASVAPPSGSVAPPSAPTAAADIPPLSAPTTGSAPPDTEKVVHDHVAAIRACYNSGRRIDPKLKGKVVETIVIETDGSVSSATPNADTPLPPAVTGCIDSILKQMKFSPPGGGGRATVHAPFDFVPP